MKVETQAFAAAMKAAAGIPTPSTIPIYSCARLEAKGGALEIRVSDLDTEYRQTLSVEGEMVGAIEAKRLASIASAAPNGSLAFTADGNRVVVQSGRSRWTMPVLPVDQFPEMPLGALCEPVTGRGLADAIRRTAWCTIDSPSKPCYSGIFLNNEDGKVRLTACNGSGFISVDTELDWPTGAPEVIVPVKFMRTLEASCRGGGDASLAWDDRKIRAETGSVTLAGKLIESGFPEYRRATPPPSDAITVLPEDIIAAARRVLLASDAKTKELRIVRGSDALTIRIPHDAGRDAVEEIPAQCDAEFESGCNANFFVQMVEAIGGETIEIHQENAGAHMLFRRVVSDGAVGVLAPMRI